MALSKASPTLPIEATTPEVRRVRPKSIEVYWTPWSLWWINPATGLRWCNAHAEGVEDELAAQVIGHRPAHDTSGAGIENHGQVEESLPGPQVGDASDPRLVRLLGDESPLNRSGATKPVPMRERFLPWRRRWMPSMPAMVIRRATFLRFQVWPYWSRSRISAVRRRGP
jgi:hypothetical protein